VPGRVSVPAILVLVLVSASLQVKSLDVFNEIMTRRAYAETCKPYSQADLCSSPGPALS